MVQKVIASIVGIIACIMIVDLSVFIGLAFLVFAVLLYGGANHDTMFYFDLDDFLSSSDDDDSGGWGDSGDSGGDGGD